MTANIHPATGVRYGVISFQDLKSWCLEDLFYGPNVENLSYQEAVTQLQAEVQAEVEAEVDDGKLLPEQAEDEVSERVERRAEHIDIDCPVLRGELDGVQYMILWLGGAPLLYVVGGLHAWGKCLCSPCVPNAVNLSDGYRLVTEEFDPEEGEYLCYAVPRDWLWEDEDQG